MLKEPGIGLGHADAARVRDDREVLHHPELRETELKIACEVGDHAEVVRLVQARQQCLIAPHYGARRRVKMIRDVPLRERDAIGEPR